MRRTNVRWTVARAVAIAVAIAVAVAGCGGSSGTPGTAPATPSAPAVTSAAASSPASGVTPATPSSPAGVFVDPGLLAFLPASVDGRSIVETPEAEHTSASDPSIARSVRALAMGYVASPSGADWVIVSVVALRPDTWSEAFFRDWRDTYDAGLCGPRGGVGGNASATIGGREVEIGTCGPLRTYHVHLAGRDVVVSVTSVGDRRYGELVMAGLRP